MLQTYANFVGNWCNKNKHRVFESQTFEFLKYPRALQQYANVVNSIAEIPHDSIVCLMSDFDIDGLLSLLVLSGLAPMLNIRLYKPNPQKGYGILPEDVQDMIAKHNPEYIIMSDVGIACNEAIAYAHQNGIQVIVIDHHEGQAQDEVPTFDPCSNGTVDVPFAECKSYCGAMLSYAVVSGVYMKWGINVDQQCLQALQCLAAIGTLGDSMDLVGHNRYVAKRLIENINADTANPQRLIDLCNTNMQKAGYVWVRHYTNFILLLSDLVDTNNLKSLDMAYSRNFDETAFTFYINPMMNAVRRLDLQLDNIYALFFMSDINDDITRYEFVRWLTGARDLRRAIEDYAVETLLTNRQEGQHVYYITDEMNSTPLGLISGNMYGLIANDILNKTGEPAFVVSAVDDNIVAGSGRLPQYYTNDFIQDVLDQFITRKGHIRHFGVDIAVANIPNLEAAIAASLSEIGQKAQDAVAAKLIVVDDATLEPFAEARNPKADVVLAPSAQEFVATIPTIEQAKPFYGFYKLPFAEPFDFVFTISSVKPLIKRDEASTLPEEERPIVSQHLRIKTKSGLILMIFNIDLNIDLNEHVKDNLKSGKTFVIPATKLDINTFQTRSHRSQDPQIFGTCLEDLTEL